MRLRTPPGPCVREGTECRLPTTDNRPVRASQIFSMHDHGGHVVPCLAIQCNIHKSIARHPADSSQQSLLDQERTDDVAQPIGAQEKNISILQLESQLIDVQ